MSLWFVIVFWQLNYTKTIGFMLFLCQLLLNYKLLEQRAYTDAHTGLPNKGACEAPLKDQDTIVEPTVCIMFDLNNLKTANDTMGHSAGDRLIMDFARILRSMIPDKDFVGRYGGDEFMAVIYHTGKTEIEELLQSLCREKDRLNSNEAQIPIDYACGWAISTDEGTYTLQMLLDKADSDMYENKQLCKKRNLG